MPPLSEQIRQHFPEIGLEAADTLCRYHELLIDENRRQNLTRLTSESDFIHLHLKDAVELIRSGFVEYPAIDLGSGGGLPGVPAAILTEGPWTLVEAEKRKAQFLEKAAEELGLQNRVRVVSDRIENFLRNEAGKRYSIVARAVGPVDRIYGWIRKCSTWNSLVLLKGPGWDEEWTRFQEQGVSRELSWSGTHEYQAGEHGNIRSLRIVKLSRVPRGTSKSEKFE